MEYEMCQNTMYDALRELTKRELKPGGVVIKASKAENKPIIVLIQPNIIVVKPNIAVIINVFENNFILLQSFNVGCFV